MKVAIALDSFKGSLSSIAAGTAAAEGVRRVFPDAECIVRPLADGGEGTVDALVAGLGGELKTVTVTGPAGKPTKAKYGLLPDGVAVMEMAEAAGITLVSGAEKNPLHTTTYGVGEMILDAVRNGARTFVIGIGGSATNDGGAGMLQALGFRLLDKDGNDIPRGGIGLTKLAKIEGVDERCRCRMDGKNPFYRYTSDLHLEFRIACDVRNPLCGPNGASAVFGPQKGATPEMVKELDEALAHFAEIVEQGGSGVSPLQEKDGTSFSQSAGDGASPLRALGEIGLDYHYSPETREAQLKLFAGQLEEARTRDLPVVIHTREADDDTLALLREIPSRGIIHCYTGTPEYAKRFLDLGFFISISGIVTFKPADNVRASALVVPDDRILIETDSPFLAPVPMRGQPNEPAFIVHTCEFLAKLRGVSADDFAELTFANAERILE